MPNQRRSSTKNLCFSGIWHQTEGQLLQKYLVFSEILCFVINFVKVNYERKLSFVL